MRGTLIATWLQVIHSSVKDLAQAGAVLGRGALQILIANALKGIIAMEVVSTHIVSRAGVADPTQADRSELALWRREMLGGTPLAPLPACPEGSGAPAHNSPRVWPWAPERHQVSPVRTAQLGSAGSWDTTPTCPSTRPLPRESGSLSWSRTSFLSQCSGSKAPQPCCLWACPSPAKGTVASLGAVSYDTQHVRACRCRCPPPRAAGSHSPAAGATSQLAGCPSAAGPRSPAAETSAGRS